MLDQQLLQKLRVGATKVGETVIIYAHPAAEPAIDVVLLAQPRQCPRASDPFAYRIKPKSQYQSWARWCLSRRVLARFDRILHRAQIELLHIIPEQPRRMVSSNQTIQVHGSQFDLIANRLAHPRLAHGIIPARGRHSWQILKQSFVHCKLQSESLLERITLLGHMQSKAASNCTKTHKLSGRGGAPLPHPEERRRRVSKGAPSARFVFLRPVCTNSQMRDGDSGSSRGSTPKLAQRIRDRIGHDPASGNDAALARALGAERIDRRRVLLQHDRADVRKIARGGNEIIRKRPGQQLAVARRIADAP